ncbi:MAG: hypothetical protein AB8H79_26200 [Myxococcota bacterium]
MRWIVGLLGACSVPQPPAPSPAPAPVTVAGAFSEVFHSQPSDLRLAVSAEAPPGLMYLCRLPRVGPDVPFHAADAKPGQQRILVFANELAWESMKEKGERSFPPGSMIVKRKPDGGAGIMEKGQMRWRYGFVSPDGQVQVDEQGTSDCAACHEHGTVPEAAAKEFAVQLGDPRDGVFLTSTEE